MAIRTTYEDITFRSRLEAQWAAFFDRIGWRGEWEYEPVDFQGYIPDFVFKWECQPYVEIKPALLEKDLLPAAQKAMDAGCESVICLGATELKETSSGLILGTFNVGAPACFCFCEACMSATIMAGSVCLRCGAAGSHGAQINEVVRFCWREAKNKTQWRGAA